ncbi:MAG: Zn-ribbon domain-containing OB-fold protein [Candidatus Aminicenantales bacterium]
MSQKKPMDDRFKRFGTVSFTAVTKVNDFVDYLEKGKVMGTRCGSCGLVFFPPRADCFRCLSSSMEWFEVKGPGTLITYSRLSYAPAGFEEDVPYCLAILDYGAYKVFGRVDSDIPEEELRPGMEMVTVAKRLPDGQLTYVFTKPGKRFIVKEEDS